MKKNNSNQKKIKSSIYYDEDVSEMIQSMSDKYHLPKNRIHNMVLRKLFEKFPDVTIWS